MSERVFILIFHGVGEPPRALEPGEERVWISRRALGSVLDAAAERRDVRLTFDDGNRSDYEHALPELLARDLRATFFVVADRIDRNGFLSAAMIRELLDAGMTVQSHGMRHRQWRGLDSSALDEELTRARGVIEEVTGRAVSEAALPFCQYDRRVLSAVRSAGYARVYTCDRGPTDPDGWLQARNQISRGENGRRVQEITSPRPLTRLEIALKAPIKRWR
ncbi:MAG: polysaccharide deacetylase family protein [Solirubrobacteraceae bacterium]